ncbi:MAG: exopolysaccharide biosynthesis polyprenyl glycosylphosphotransferase [Hydrogenoanaerobacterium sp.]
MQRNKYRHIIMFMASFAILAVVTALWAFVWYTSYADIIINPFFRKGNWLVVGIYSILSFTFTNIYGGYKIGYLKRGDVMFSAILSTMFVNTVTFLQASLMARRWLPIRPMLALTVVDVICIVIWAALTHKLYQKLHPPHKMLAVYGGDSIESLVDKFSTRSDKYQVVALVSMLEGLPRVMECVAEYDTVILCDIKSDARNEILKYCFSHSIRTYLTPKISDTIVRGADEIHLFDTPLLLCKNRGLTFEQNLVKRIVDLLLSTIALLFFSPFFLLIGVAIKLYDGGPVLYKQTRLTLDGKKFMLYKFRSMVVDAENESGARLAGRDDERITPVGRFIRKLRLDEFPQLINIIKGDMSIVGPRPERPEIAREYENYMPEFSFRLKVKAGLTGYAQVVGKYNTTPYDKLKLDLMYIEKYSLRLDIKLILMTIKILFMPASTEGVNTATEMQESLIKK